MHAAPFACWRPAPERAAEFAALPYDVWDEDDARAYVATHPTSFLAIDRPETGFPAGQDPTSPEVYAHARTLLDEREKDGTLVRDAARCYYLWRLRRGDHTQTGIVAACSVDDYLDGTIRRHESTREDKELDRVRHIEALDAQTGPIFLAYRDEPVLDLIVSAAMTGQPLYDFTDEGGVRQTVWRVARPDAVGALEAMLDRVPQAYIADGHHRAASAARVCQRRRQEHPNATAAAPFNSFLAVLFPADQLQILPYDRVVADTNGLSEEELVRALEEQGFRVGPRQEAPVEPQRKGLFGLWAFGAWRALSFEPRQDEAADVVSSLDCAVLQDHALGPVLGIGDPRRDPRVSFVGGAVAPAELEGRAGTTGVAFTLHATSMDELMAVADAGRLMPPKSTWFEPKLLSGLFVRPI